MTWVGVIMQVFMNKLIEGFIQNSLFRLDKLIAILIVMVFRVHSADFVSIGVLLVFLLPGELGIVVGMQQLEDKYEGGEIGLSVATRDRLKINHLQQLERLDLQEESSVELTVTFAG
jgi:hypothetical protein